MDIEVEGAVLEQETHGKKIDGWVAFAAGLTSGCAGILVGQPFDTVKVRLQTASHGTYSGPLRCLRDTVHKEGVTALFKGLGPPLASAPIVNAIAFAAYVQASKVSHVSLITYMYTCMVHDLLSLPIPLGATMPHQHMWQASSYSYLRLMSNRYCLS
eukprot:TRINITY_DN629_c0_g1_i4.p1 TRINITY_DN629_c0_g1~~TRINITY_DN629_c0_g1_i4.p1  ORF type:complete len:157 (-),score=14.11 TRINITY_DN629_c0_g1_i4:1854-2324(-)